jgi:formylglycine-generating enzyme required for sulfatase activity
MSAGSQRKEMLGAIFGLGLLVFAMAWRWLFPLLAELRWPDWGAAAPVVEVLPAPMPKAVEPQTADPVDATASVAADATLEPVKPTELDAAARKQLDEMLAQANDSVRERHWLAPRDDNAMDWYAKALQIDPTNSEARIGQEAVLETLFKQAEAGLDDGDPSLANELIEALNARDIADQRAHQLASRRALGAQITPLLQTAAEQMAGAAYIEPAGANARASYAAVLALDPRNRAARKGMAAIESALLEMALNAASEEDFARAQQMASEAASLQADSEAVRSVQARLDDLRSQHAAVLMARADAALAARDITGARELLQRAGQIGADLEAMARLNQLIANASLYGRFQPGERIRDPYADRSGEGPELVVIPVGSFVMGSSERDKERKANEGPAREVGIVQPFAMAITEITVAEYRRFVRDTGYVTVAEAAGSSRYYEEQSGRLVSRSGIDWQNDYSGGKARANDPVVHIAWRDASAYAVWLAGKTGLRYRLPTEAEFEYVLRAGTSSAYPWGEGAPPKVLANVTGDGDRSRSKREWDKAFKRYRDGYWGPAPVAQFSANPLGLHDLVGNVSEWVEDCWHENYLRAPEDASAWVNRGCLKRVVRGSSWGSAPDQSRSAFRANAGEDTRSARIGFRVVRDL